MKLITYYTPSHKALHANLLASHVDEYAICVHSGAQWGSGSYSDPGFKRATRDKVRAILAEATEDFVYADADVIFLRPSKERLALEAEGYDAVFQDDGPGNMCSGLFAMRANAKTRAFLERWLAECGNPSDHDDQVTLNRLLPASGLRHKALSGRFANRHTLACGDGYFTLPPTTIAYHANHMVGIDAKLKAIAIARERTRFVNLWGDVILDDPCLLFWRGHDGLVAGSVFGNGHADLVFSNESVSVTHDGSRFRWRNGNVAGTADWFVGIPRIDHPRALYLPEFYNQWHHYDTHKIRPSCEKEFGVSILVSHGGAGLAQWRIDLAHTLSRYVPVHAPLSLKDSAPASSKVIYHEVGARYGGDWWTPKLEFVSRYTHNLCCENSRRPSYLTEKLFDALYCGSVPIYAGDPEVSNYFPPSSYLSADLPLEALVEQITRNHEIRQTANERRASLCVVGLDEMRERVAGLLARVKDGIARTRAPTRS